MKQAKTSGSLKQPQKKPCHQKPPGASSPEKKRQNIASNRYRIALITLLCKNMQADAKVLIEDQEVDPRIVTALPAPSCLPSVHIEICIPSQVVLHELQESCDPSLTADRLSGFLAEDARDYRAREAYLAMVVAVAALPTGEKATNPNHWNWSDTLEVREVDGQIHFIGTAIPQ